MKANHHVEASRWVQAIGKSIEWYRREGGGGSATTDGEADGAGSGRPRKSYESEDAGGSVRSHLGTTKWTATLMKRGKSDQDSLSSFKVGGEMTPLPVRGVVGGEEPEKEDDGDDEGDEGEDDVRADESSASSGPQVPPHEVGFELQANSAAAQMELTAQLFSNLGSSTGTREKELKVALKESFSAVQGMLNEYVEMVRERETWYRKQLDAERKKQKFWEESFAVVVKEGETLEKELRVRSRRRGSRFFDGTDGGTTLKQRPLVIVSPARQTIPEEYFPSHSLEPPDKKEPLRPGTQESVSSGMSHITVPAKFTEEQEDVNTDDEDEFFDAIESGTLPNLVVPDELAMPVHDLSLLKASDMAPYDGYKNLRLGLDLGEDRPSTSLWSVLKHSIGKDLTKISFPVFFNEPTSMLQRMAEDMEFSECREYQPVYCSSSLLRFAEGCRSHSRCSCPSERPTETDSVRRCVCHVELFVDDRANCQAFQSYACELLSVMYHMPEAFAL